MNLKGSLPSFGFLVLLLFVFSCGSGYTLPTPQSYTSPRYIDRVPNDPRNRNLIEREFIPLVHSFETMQDKVVTTPVYFVNNLPTSVLGVCIVWRKEPVVVKEIQINRKTYGQSRTESEMVLFHELGHCELGRDHTEVLTQTKDGRVIPFSLMFPTIFTASDYMRHHEHYIIELFSGNGLLEPIANFAIRSNADGLEWIEERDGFDGYVFKHDGREK